MVTFHGVVYDDDSVFGIADEGDFSLLRHLLEYTGINLDKKDKEGNTVLYHAVKSGNQEMIHYLTERATLSPLEGNRNGEPPYDLAYQLHQTETLDYFAKRTGFAYEESYHNPIRRGFFPDPSIVRVGRDFYMVNSTFHFFPCIPIAHSTDLVHWNIIGYAITNREWSKLDDKDGGRGYWAPDISWSDGRFFITATLRGNDEDAEKRIQMVTSSVHPEGPYDEPSWIHEDGIDPSLFHDCDGKHYMLLNRGARIMNLSSDCKREVSDPFLLWLGSVRRTPEGPHLMKKGEYYYLFLAEGGTGVRHCMTVARSKSIMGPYAPCPYNPILTQRDKDGYLQCCGHGMPVETEDGNWYLVHLCLRSAEDGYAYTGRETALEPMTWTSDGWPLVNNGQGPADMAKKPKKGETREEPVLSCYPKWMGRDWMTPRPLSQGKLSVVDGDLHLTGNGEELCSKLQRSILVERQQEFDFTASCVLTIHSLGDTESIGLTCYYDEHSFLTYGVSVKDDRYGMTLQEYVSDRYVSATFLAFPDQEKIVGEKICLRLRTKGKERLFSYRFVAMETYSDEQTLKDTSYLASEGLPKGKRFTGATVGIYVKGSLTGVFQEWRIDFLSSVPQ